MEKLLKLQFDKIKVLVGVEIVGPSKLVTTSVEPMKEQQQEALITKCLLMETANSFHSE